MLYKCKKDDLEFILYDNEEHTVEELQKEFGIEADIQLDKNPDIQLPVDVLSRFRTYMEPLGVKPSILVPYRRACEEGWAPAPTNEYQKAIWDKVHAAPKNPMKIEFDPKKGR